MSDTLRWQPELPALASDNWRLAQGATRGEGARRYQYTDPDPTIVTSYQAPGARPIPFIYTSMKLSSGMSVETAEYPFFGLWSSTPLNEKPQGITVSGFLRGPEYLRARNALIAAFRIISTDESPGFLSLPLWGRFPVIVVDWDIEESAKEQGQCTLSLTCVRAGCPVPQRWEQTGPLSATIPEAADQAKNQLLAHYASTLATRKDNDTLISGFTLARKTLLDIVGRMQGPSKKLNDLTCAVVDISNLIAQGIHEPIALARAHFAAIDAIVAALIEVKNALEQPIASFRRKNNPKNILFSFLAAATYSLPIQAVTTNQTATKQATDTLLKAAAFYAASRILPQLDGQTYDRAGNLWTLYTRLEQSIDRNDPAIYAVITALSAAVSRDMAAKHLNQELTLSVDSAMPILALAHYLGSGEPTLRDLNTIEDSLVLSGVIRYV